MRRATLTTNNPDLIWGIVGASLVTAAGIALTICTFGTGGPLAGLGTAGVWSAVIAGIGTTTAALGSAGIASVAEQLKDAPDVDYAFVKKGFYPLLENFQHKAENKRDYK
jgi:hypothetical protein